MIASPVRFCTDETIIHLIDKYCPQNNVTILDVGCGKGYYCSYFTLLGIKGSYMGIDVKKYETWDKQKIKQNDIYDMDIHFLVYDAEKLQNLSKRFDFIISIQSLEHIRNDKETVKGMAHCLKKKGYILLTIPSRYSYLLYGPHGYRRYSVSSIAQVGHKNGLSVVEIIKIGGISTFIIHFIAWTVPAVIFRTKIWELYKTSKFITNLITKMEKYAHFLDKYARLTEGGYAVVLKKKSYYELTS